jgi:predicted dehydrogenase
MLRIIQVGLGYWGLNWARTVLPSVKTVETVAWVDADPQRGATHAEVLCAARDQLFSSLGDALSAVNADAVIVLTNLESHAPLVETALRAGKHVLVEKPFVPTVEAGLRLVELAEASGLVLMVSQNFRFFPAALAAAQLVRDGRFGPIGSAHIDFRKHFVFADERLAQQEHRLSQPLLMDLGIHLFDLMRMVLNREPIEVSCRSWNPVGSPYIDPPAATATITFGDGIVVDFRGSMISRGPETTFSGDWFIEFAEGGLSWASRGDRDVSLDGERLTFLPLAQSNHVLELPAMDHFGRAGALVAFADAIASGRYPAYFPSGRDNLGSLALMAATLGAAKTGQAVQVADFRSGHRAVAQRLQP